MAKKNNGERGGYDVGYGKPPLHSRFKPGHSGNPKGRPKGTSNFKTDVKVALTTPVKVAHDGKPRTISTQQAALLRLRAKALSGDARALDQLIRLAQQYNNEEAPPEVGISGDDATVLDIFTSRVLRGAAGIPLSSDTTSTRSSEQPSNGNHRRKSKRGEADA